MDDLHGRGFERHKCFKIFLRAEFPAGDGTRRQDHCKRLKGVISLKGRNCPNCGAPYEIGINRCPYCGTVYFDMSTIDFDTKEPFYLSFRYNGVLYTQRVYPEDCKITAERHESYYNNGRFDRFLSVTTSVDISTEISFRNVPDGKVCFTARKLE